MRLGDVGVRLLGALMAAVALPSICSRQCRHATIHTCLNCAFAVPLRSTRLSSPYLRWLACLLALLLLFGEQGELRHVLSHLPQTGVAFSDAGRGTEQPPAPDHAVCPECAAFAALDLDLALPVLVLWALGLALRWHFPPVRPCAGTPVFAVAVRARDPPSKP